MGEFDFKSLSDVKREEEASTAPQTKYESKSHKELEANIRRSTSFQQLDKQLTTGVDVTTLREKKEIVRNLFIKYDGDAEMFFEMFLSSYEASQAQIKKLANNSPYGYEMYNPLLMQMEQMHRAFINMCYYSSRLHYLYKGHYNAVYKAYRDNTLGDVNEAVQKRVVELRKQVNTLEMITNLKGDK